VVDRVVIIRDGRLGAETDIADLPAARVTVRVDRTEALLGALGAAGVDHELLADGAIAVADRAPDEVGALAARAGVTVTELGRSRTGEALEALFLDLTGGNGR